MEPNIEPQTTAEALDNLQTAACRLFGVTVAEATSGLARLGQALRRYGIELSQADRLALGLAVDPAGNAVTRPQAQLSRAQPPTADQRSLSQAREAAREGA